MRGRRIALSVVVALAAMTRVAAGDPTYLHLKTPSTVQTDGGTNLRLPPGYFLDEDTHSKLDAEMRRLQGVETQLQAENKHLRGTLNSWQPGWIVLVSAVVGGIALGGFVVHKL